MSAMLLCFTALLLISEGQSEIDVTWFNDTLIGHFSQPRHHMTNPAYKASAKDFIAAEFQRMGLRVYLHTFSTDHEAEKGVNVVGVLPGPDFNTSSDTIIAIGAHYDTVYNSAGVNDNGVAVVVMLAVAQELVQLKDRNGTVLFVAFDLQEMETNVNATCREGLCGSAKLIQEWLPTLAGWETGWKGIFVMDSIANFDSTAASQRVPEGAQVFIPETVRSIQSDGGKGDFILVARRETSEEDELINHFNLSWSSLGNPIYEMEDAQLLTLARDFVRSDHTNFWSAEKAAVVLTDTASYRGYMETCYHEPCDDMTHVTSENLYFALKTAAALVDVIGVYVRPMSSVPANGYAGCRSVSRLANAADRRHGQTPSEAERGLLEGYGQLLQTFQLLAMAGRTKAAKTPFRRPKPSSSRSWWQSAYLFMSCYDLNLYLFILLFSIFCCCYFCCCKSRS